MVPLFEPLFITSRTLVPLAFQWVRTTSARIIRCLCRAGLLFTESVVCLREYANEVIASRSWDQRGSARSRSPRRPPHGELKGESVLHDSNAENNFYKALFMTCSVAERLFAVETVGIRIVWDATIKDSETAGVGEAFFIMKWELLG